MLKISAKGLQAGAKKLSSQLLIALMIVGLVAFIGVFVWQTFRIKEMQAQLKVKQAALAEVQERNDLLKEHLDFYNSPGYMLYVEKVAREALGLSKPGETVILTVPDKNVAGPPNLRAAATTAPASNAATTAAATTPPAAKKPSWQSWFSFFFGGKE